MATSGSKSVKVTDWDTLKFSWSEKSQSIANNTTTISWKLELIATSYGYISSSASKAWSVTVNGTKYSGTTTVGINNNSTKTLASGTTTIAHSSDGTKSFDYSFSQAFDINFNGWVGTISGSGSGTLDSIPRVSKPTLSASSGEFGAAVTIYTNRASSDFTHKLFYKYGNSGWIAITSSPSVTTSYAWTVPLELMNQIPSSTSLTLTIACDTYVGSTYIGYATVEFTAKVPSSVKPSCTMTLEDVTNWDDTYGSPVQGLSKIKIKISAGLSYSSPIASYSISANGVKYTTAEATTDVLKTAGDSPVTVTVKDKRGRSATASYTMKVQAYNPPNITALTVHRVNATNLEDDQGEYINVKFSAVVSEMAGKNTATYTLKYKKSTESQFTTVELTGYSGAYELNNVRYRIAADSNSSYDIELTAKDRHDTATRSTSASTAFTLMNWGADGTSLGIGKVAEEVNSLDVAVNLYSRGTLRTMGNRYAAASYGTSGATGFIKMVSIEIMKDYADTPLTFVFNRRLAKSPMTVHVTFQSKLELDPSLDSITYEGSNYGAFIVQSSTSVWDLYVEKVSGYDSITLLDWHVSALRLDRFKITFPGTNASTVPTPYYRATPLVAESILDAFMPVGFVLTLYSHADPNSMYPGTTWTRITNAFLWACDANGTIGQTGGEKSHTLTVNELPSHSHGSVYSGNVSGTKTHSWMASGGSNMAYGTVAAGGGEAHNNMPPYIQVSIWRRTA